MGIGKNNYPLSLIFELEHVYCLTIRRINYLIPQHPVFSHCNDHVHYTIKILEPSLLLRFHAKLQITKTNTLQAPNPSRRGAFISSKLKTRNLPNTIACTISIYLLLQSQSIIIEPILLQRHHLLYLKRARGLRHRIAV